MLGNASLCLVFIAPRHCSVKLSIEIKDTEKDLKHPRKANRNRTIAKLREVWLCLLLEPDASVRDAVLEEILSALVRFPVSIVKGRSPQRKKPRNMRFPIAKKSVL